MRTWVKRVSIGRIVELWLARRKNRQREYRGTTKRARRRWNGERRGRGHLWGRQNGRFNHPKILGKGRTSSMCVFPLSRRLRRKTDRSGTVYWRRRKCLRRARRRTWEAEVRIDVAHSGNVTIEQTKMQVELANSRGEEKNDGSWTRQSPQTHCLSGTAKCS